MEWYVKFLGNLAAFAAGMFFTVILTSLYGYAAGWAVSFFFADTFKQVFLAFHIDATQFTLAQFGAVVGFVGGFMKTKVNLDTRALLKLADAELKK